MRWVRDLAWLFVRKPFGIRGNYECQTTVTSSIEKDILEDLVPKGLLENISKIFRSTGPARWKHVSQEAYKKDDTACRGVSRKELVGKLSETTAFCVRCFEVEKGGFYTLEKHQHEHAVMVTRGSWSSSHCELSNLSHGDGVFVFPNDPHQFMHLDHDELIGTLCIVNAERNTPESGDGIGFCEICEQKRHNRLLDSNGMGPDPLVGF